MNKKIYKVIKTPCFNGDINSMVLFANDEKEAKEMFITTFNRVNKIKDNCEKCIITVLELGNVSKKLLKADEISSDMFDITYENEEIIKY